MAARRAGKEAPVECWLGGLIKSLGFSAGREGGGRRDLDFCRRVGLFFPSPYGSGTVLGDRAICLDPDQIVHEVQHV